MAVSHRNLSRSVLSLALLCSSGVAWAQAYSAFSTDTIYGSLQHAEAVSFNEAVAGVLKDAKTDATTLWTSPAKRRTPITAKLSADDRKTACLAACCIRDWSVAPTMRTGNSCFVRKMASGKPFLRRCGNHFT